DTSAEHVTRKVMQMTGKAGVDSFFDAVGGKVAHQAINCLKQGKTAWLYGALSLEPTPINSATMIFQDVRIRGFWLTTWLPTLTQTERITFIKEALGMLATGQMPVEVAETFPFSSYKEAVAAAEAPGKSAKVLFKLG
ncbi:MAG: zinc-binding dehydrogenase, partial [Bacteroidota bacterium]